MLVDAMSKIEQKSKHMKVCWGGQARPPTAVSTSNNKSGVRSGRIGVRTEDVGNAKDLEEEMLADALGRAWFADQGIGVSISGKKETTLAKITLI